MRNRLTAFLACLQMNATRVVDAGRNLAIAGFVGGTALVASNAHAGEFADAITDEIATAKAEATLVAVVVLGLVGFFLLLKMIRRAAH